MEATYTDEKGEKHNYEISYSQEMQKKILSSLKQSNYLKAVLLFLFLSFITILCLVLFDTGVLGAIARKGFCY